MNVVESCDNCYLRPKGSHFGCNTCSHNFESHWKSEEEGKKYEGKIDIGGFIVDSDGYIVGQVFKKNS